MEQEIEFIPFDYDYFDFHGRNYIKIIGRDGKGKKTCVIDSFKPYFYAVLKQGVTEKKIGQIVKKIQKIKIKSASRITKVEKVEVLDKKFLGEKVKALKIFITNFKDAHAVADKLGMKEIVKIDKFVGKVHKEFMNTKTTPEDHMTRDMWFSMNLLQLALYNLQRWSETTTTPCKTFPDDV